jgi:hypothetical protein
VPAAARGSDGYSQLPPMISAAGAPQQRTPLALQPAGPPKLDR